MPLPGNLTTIRVTGDAYLTGAGGALAGFFAFAPNVDLADATGPAIIRTAPIQVNVAGGTMTPIDLVCTDNPDLSPAGWAWTLTERLDGARSRTWSFYLPSTAGAVIDGVRVVDLAALVPLGTPPTLVQYLLMVNNLNDVADAAAAFGNIKQDATTEATGVVQLAGDLGGTAEAPEVLGIQGTAIQPPPGGTTMFLRADGGWAAPAGGGGGTPSSTVAAATSFGIASNAGAATEYSRGDHTHGTPATPTAGSVGADPAGSASSAYTAAVNAAAASAAGLYIPLSGGAMTGALAMGGNKITGGAAGVASTDFVIVSQIPTIPTSLPPSGAASGDLGGNYPAPTLANTANVQSIVRANRLDQMAAPTSALGLNSQKISSLANGAVATDAATVGQLPAPGAVTGLATFGVASANGVAATFARSDHVHGAPDAYVWDSPAQRGWAEWNYPPSISPAVSQNLTSGTVYGISFIAQTNKPFSKVAVQVVSSASTPTAGENLIAVYTVAGTAATEVGATADLGTWGAAGLQPYSVGASQNAVAGTVYIVLFLSVAGTPVHLQGITSDTAAQIGFLNLGTSNSATPWLKFFVYGTGQTALPSSFTISAATMSGTSALAPFVCFL